MSSTECKSCINLLYLFNLVYLTFDQLLIWTWLLMKTDTKVAPFSFTSMFTYIKPTDSFIVILKSRKRSKFSKGLEK